MFAPSSRNLPESLSTPISFGDPNICHYFQDFFFRGIVQPKSFEIVKLGQYLTTDCKLYLSEGFRSLNRREDSVKHVSQFKVSFSSFALKLNITVLFGILRDLMDAHNSLGLPIVSERFSSKQACFFDAISFQVLYFDFLYNLLSIWSSDFLNFLKYLCLSFNFSDTSLSNHF